MHELDLPYLVRHGLAMAERARAKAEAAVAREEREHFEELAERIEEVVALAEAIRMHGPEPYAVEALGTAAEEMMAVLTGRYVR